MGALAQARSTFRRLSAEQATGIDWRKADGTKDHPVWASVPIETEPCKYDLVVVLALNPIRDESIILGEFKLALQHRGTGSSSSARHPKPSAVVESSSTLKFGPSLLG